MFKKIKILFLCCFRILKSVEFSNTETSGTEQEGNKSLETLLLEKNRSLQNENTKLKNSNTEVTGMLYYFCESHFEIFNIKVHG